MIRRQWRKVMAVRGGRMDWSLQKLTRSSYCDWLQEFQPPTPVETRLQPFG